MSLKLEFIHTCSCCDVLSDTLLEIAEENKNIDLKVYYAGKDFDYIPKYGMVTKGTLIVNESERYEETMLNKKVIKNIIEETMQKSKGEGK